MLLSPHFTTPRAEGGVDDYHWINAEKLRQHLDWWSRSTEYSPFISVFDNEGKRAIGPAGGCIFLSTIDIRRCFHVQLQQSHMSERFALDLIPRQIGIVVTRIASKKLEGMRQEGVVTKQLKTRLSYIQPLCLPTLEGIRPSSSRRPSSHLGVPSRPLYISPTVGTLIPSNCHSSL